jgi:hypothetical protein
LDFERLEEATNQRVDDVTDLPLFDWSDPTDEQDGSPELPTVPAQMPACRNRDQSGGAARGSSDAPALHQPAPASRIPDAAGAAHERMKFARVLRRDPCSEPAELDRADASWVNR